MDKGLFIAIEGNEGAGKSTMTNFIFNFLKDKNIDIIKTREPGGSKIAEAIRDLIFNHELDPLAEAYTFAASRIQHLKDVITPSLEQKKVVLCDRFLDSSIAYQGFGRKLGVSKILEINKLAVGNNYPDLTIILNVNPKIGLERIAKQKSREVNRMDRESIEFHNRCHEGFKELIEIFPERNFVVVDASQSIEKVKEEILNILKKQFKSW